ncbi:MAG: RecX family transcriptional regulator [Lachnospiraceae bacterium]|nr:RecX family transcriptional regulator [Lachnospiraceae bacterium]
MLQDDFGFNPEIIEEKSENEIKGEVKRAKLRALHLLTAMDRTEANLREKLSASYCEEAVESAVEYVKSFGYLDDDRYVRNYIESKSRTKSRKQIEQELIFQKGVSKEAVQRGFEEAQMADITEVIQKYMQKKKINPENCDYEQKKKFYAYMMRKGFQIEDLKMVFDLT